MFLHGLLVFYFLGRHPSRIEHYTEFWMGRGQGGAGWGGGARLCLVGVFIFLLLLYIKLYVSNSLSMYLCVLPLAVCRGQGLMTK